jgi:site-specific DNA-cytosine methylase
MVDEEVDAAMNFVDVWGLAGSGVILGAVDAGFTMAHRASHGFGDEVVEANRHLLGDGWQTETIADPDDGGWQGFQDISYVTGVPPCSGFSSLNTSQDRARATPGRRATITRGSDSLINSCQHELVRYAGSRLEGADGQAGPEVVVFESVQGAFTKGLDLMRTYWDTLRETSGQDYHLTHVLHNDASLGGSQMRSRYFWVAHRIPFGLHLEELPLKPRTTRDAIGDLMGLRLTWSPQRYRRKGKASERWRRGGLNLVTAHDVVSAQGHGNRMEEVYDYYLPGEDYTDACKRFREVHGHLPAYAAAHWKEKEDEFRGFANQPRQLPWDEPSWVLTGGGPWDYVHPAERRLLTARECARLMGVPDSWRLPTEHAAIAGKWLGKNCPLEAGRWIADEVARNLIGDVGPDTRYGRRAAKFAALDDETIVDVTNTWKAGHL